jgi:hypothetical protein
MDSIRFDTLTKALTSRGGRRTVLRRIAGGAGVALAAAAEPRAGRAARGRCPTGQRRCPGSRGACVDLQTDPKHCGRCGNDCSSCHSCGGECCAGVCGLSSLRGRSAVKAATASIPSPIPRTAGAVASTTRPMSARPARSAAVAVAPAPSVGSAEAHSRWPRRQRPPPATL